MHGSSKTHALDFIADVDIFNGKKVNGESIHKLGSIYWETEEGNDRCHTYIWFNSPTQV